MSEQYLISDASETLFYKALEKKYEAEIAECIATLETYFHKAVGIGEHSDLLVEFDKYMEKLSAATDKLETLRKTFSSKS